MKKFIIFFSFLFVLIAAFNVFGGGMVGLDAFRKEVWSDKKFNEIAMGEVRTAQMMLAKKESTDNIVGLKIELPDNSLSNSIVMISSYVAHGYIYAGPYKNIIKIHVAKEMLKNEHPDYNGFDMLGISFFDLKNKTTYTCTQEKLYKVWEEDKIATVQFLESRKPDQNGQPLCYSVHISGDL